MDRASALLTEIIDHDPIGAQRSNALGEGMFIEVGQKLQRILRALGLAEFGEKLLHDGLAQQVAMDYT
jgi:hypothetical protein